MSSTIPRSLIFFPRAFKKSGLCVNLQIRHSSQVISKLEYAEYGDPVKVVKKVHENFPDALKPNEVLIKMLASPVNPADINTIQGKYPVRPTLPAVPGNEGVGEVVSIGNQVNEYSVGDRVVPMVRATGTWRTHMILLDSSLMKIPQKMGLVEAATLQVNPCTAYRMLRDFVPLKPGDSVIQNGGNSAAGQNVIQISRAWGVRSVNVVRNRSNILELKDYLTSLGASYVLTEEELRSTDIFKSGKLPPPRLALNAVGGKSSMELLRHLGPQGTMVTYGGMSREPVMIPTGLLIFKDVRIRGFWMTEWFKKNGGSAESKDMFDELISMMTCGELKGPAHAMIPFENYKEALNNAMTAAGMIGKKFILDFQNT